MCKDELEGAENHQADHAGILPSVSSNLSSLLLVCSPAQLIPTRERCLFKVLTASLSTALNNNLITACKCSKSASPRSYGNIKAERAWLWSPCCWTTQASDRHSLSTSSVRKQSHPIIYHCRPASKGPCHMWFPRLGYGGHQYLAHREVMRW